MVDHADGTDERDRHCQLNQPGVTVRVPFYPCYPLSACLQQSGTAMATESDETALATTQSSTPTPFSVEQLAWLQATFGATGTTHGTGTSGNPSTGSGQDSSSSTGIYLDRAGTDVHTKPQYIHSRARGHRDEAGRARSLTLPPVIASSISCTQINK